MPHVRRIAQGLLVAFTISTVLPPVPAWALRQKEAAQVDDTTAGLEEGMTGKPTTMNRREFLKRGAVVVGAAAVGGGVGATAAEALMRTAVAPAGTAIHRPWAIPVIASGPFTGSLVTTEQLGPSPAIRFEWTMPLRSRGEQQADGTMAYPRPYRADGSLGPMIYAEGHRHFDLALAFPIDGGGRIVRAQDYDAYPALARGVPVSVGLRLRGFEGIDLLVIGEGIDEKRYSGESLKRGVEVEIPLGRFVRPGDVKIPVYVSYTESTDPKRTQIPFAFTALPDSYIFQDRAADTHRSVAIAAAAVAGAAAAGGATALALAPVDAEKVLAELLSTNVGDVKRLASQQLSPTHGLLILVDDSVSDPSAIHQSAFANIPGYPDVVVASWKDRESYIQTYPARMVITLLGEGAQLYKLYNASGDRMDAWGDTVWVQGLSTQRIESHLVATVVTAAIAEWYRHLDDQLVRHVDVAPYLALSGHLTAEQVERVLHSQFA